jgi:protoheme IX farnesyltransferase
MLPVVRGARETRRQIVLYTVLLAAASLSPWVLGVAGPIYGLSAAVLGGAFLWQSWRVWRDRQDAAGVSLTKDAPAKLAFKYSLYYLFALFTALAVDRLVG